MYHKTEVTGSARVSQASHHSRREERAWPFGGSNQDSPVSHSRSTHFPCSSVTCPLSLHHHAAALPCPTPYSGSRYQHQHNNTSPLQEQASSTNKQPPQSLSCERLLHHHLSALTPSLLCRLPDAGPGRRNHVESLLTSETLQRDPQPDTQEHVDGTAPADIQLYESARDSRAA
jgi:hypothetical protein